MALDCRAVFVAWLTAMQFSCTLGQLVPALFVFGNSLVDVGNNNALATPAKANHPPYGVDFPNHEATGRFSNGLLVVDLVASYLGLPYPPAYLLARNNTLQGANFGSASSGILPQTRLGAALVLSKQVDYFQTVQRSLVKRLGKSRSACLISESIFYIASGNNDVNNLYKQFGALAPRDRRKILAELSKQIHRLYSLGARKFVIVGISAVGCVPLNQINGTCDPAGQTAASYFNTGLATTLDQLRASLKRVHIVLTNFYGLMVEVKNNPGAFGFADATLGCCPVGQASLNCTVGTPYCSDRTKFVFWDGIHQTEAFNRIAAARWWSGSSPDVTPMNIHQLAAFRAA